MKMEDFKIGDVVTLKSGGHKMTVESFLKEYNRVICIWFDDFKIKRGDSFEPECLIISKVD